MVGVDLVLSALGLDDYANRQCLQFFSLPARVAIRLLERMTKKLLLWVGVLTLFTVAIVSAKTYEIVFSTPVQVGTVQLAPGTYKLSVEGSNAIFTDTKTRKSVTVPARVEDGNAKYDVTSLESSGEGAATQIGGIKLGGTKTRLGFGK